MTDIALTRGFIAVVDDDVFETVGNHKWYAMIIKNPDGTIRHVYAARSHKQKNFRGETKLMHRVITNCPIGMQVDHIDGNGLNNTRDNLRICTHSDNQHNQRAQKGKSSRFKGVHRVKLREKWSTSIKVNRVTKFLGHFDTEIEAAIAYNDAARLYFGEFAKTNDIR